MDTGKNAGLLNAGGYTLPSWQAFEKMVDGIWDREYYTNHGPLVVELEAKIEKLLGVKHAVCMTNASIALMIAIKALEVEGTVAIPAFSHVNTGQSVYWAGLKPVYCDVEKTSPCIDVTALDHTIQKDTRLVVAAHAFGEACNVEGLSAFAADRALRMAFISDAVFGQKYKGKPFGHFGDLEIFSFRESQFINGADGACVCTSDDLTAAKLRNIRSSYGAGKPVPISYTGNGRMSEIQAGLILLSLEAMEKNAKDNQQRFQQIKNLVKNPGVSVFESSADVSERTYSEIILQFTGENADQRRAALKASLDQMRIGNNAFDLFGLDAATHKVLTGFENTNAFMKNTLLIQNNQQISAQQLEIIGKHLI